MNDTWVTMKTSPKTEETSEATSTPQTAANRITKLTKPAKVPSWTKNISLETNTKQITTWMAINGDVLKHVTYPVLMDELKKNNEIKGIQSYVAEHVIPVLINVED